MKPEIFDDLTRQVARRVSRRRLLQFAGAGSLAGLVGLNTLPAPALAARPGCGVRTIVLWVNAFIPNDFPPVRTVPGGPHAGETMIDGPIAGISDCFLTDNRSFDNRMNSAYAPSSRLTAWVNVDLENATILNQTVFGHHTVEVDCEDGEVECDVFPQPGGPGFHDISRFGDRITLKLRGWAHDPCFHFTPGIFVPDVDIDLRITIDVEPSGEAGVTVDGAIDLYPAFEIYVMPDGAGDTQTLLQRYPDPGTSPASLLRSNLDIPVFAQTRVSNSNSCSDPNQVCCPHDHGNDNCCPSDNPVCCPNDLGGACCPGGWGCCPPGHNGELYCCLPGWSCCGSTQVANNGCCPPDARLCCPLDAGGGCCPDSNPLCCPGNPPFCCPTSHPICFNHPELGPRCGRAKQGVSAERARATGEFEDSVPPRLQSSRPGTTSGKKPAGRRRVPSIPRRRKSTRTGR